jgi:hypothetical protein
VKFVAKNLFLPAKNKNILLLLQPFHKQQGWCPAEKMETILFKRKNIKQCQEKNVLTSRTSVVAKVYTVSGSACQPQMAVKFWQAVEKKGAIN